jgi:UDP-N-acetylglucosamine:LPS N-acetylglucosamine transferase
MRSGSGRAWRWLATTAVVAAFAVAAPGAGAATFSWMDGYDHPATPNPLDKVGVLKEGPPDAKRVLILLPGTSGGAGYLAPLAQEIASKAKHWQVWALERRENLFEDHKAADQLKRGEATAQQMFDYYLGWVINPNIRDHYTFPFGGPSYTRDWGMRVAVEDVRRVVQEARKGSRQVVLGGHSLGA